MYILENGEVAVWGDLTYFRFDSNLSNDGILWFFSEYFGGYPVTKISCGWSHIVVQNGIV